jgi:type IV pilus assembly protein PilA
MILNRSLDSFRGHKERPMHSMSGTRRQGFSLIELMVAMAIVAVLATLALPAYSSYVNRAKMTEGIVHLSAAKTSIAEFLANHSRLPSVEEVTETLPNGPVSSYIASIEAEVVGATEATSNEQAVAEPAEDKAPSAPAAQGSGPNERAAIQAQENWARRNATTAQAEQDPTDEAAVVSEADSTPATESALRLVAQMNPDAFMGMRANENDRLMLEAQWVGGSLRWSCKPHPDRGVRPDWLPASCRP